MSNRTRIAVLPLAALVAAGVVLGAPAAVADEEDVELSVVIPAVGPGEFIWSAPAEASFGTATLSGNALQATTTLEVTVDDTRPGKPGWEITGKATRFELQGDQDVQFSSAYLGWNPTVTEAGAGAVAGAEVPTAFDPSNPGTPLADPDRGLLNDRVLANAPLGHGGATATSGTIEVELTLQAPTDLQSGTYESWLNLSAEVGG